MQNRDSSAREERRRSMSGEFDVATASQALDMILAASLHGSLMISDGLVDVCFFFTRGGLRVIASGRDLPTLRSRLGPYGLLTPVEVKKIDRLFDPANPSPADEREVLMQAGVSLRGEDVDKAAREIILEVFLDSLFWDAPQYEVTTGEPDIGLMQRPGLSVVTLSLGIKNLLTEIKTKLRSVSEVRRTVANMRVIAVATPKGREVVASRAPLGEGDVGKRRKAFLKRIVDEPGLGAEELAQRLGVGELEVASRLHELSGQGYLKITRKARSKEEELERIRAMEEAVDQALNQLLRRVRLASDSASVGEAGRAARHMARAGGILLQRGRAEEAVHTFKGALGYSEDDLEAREGYVQGLWAAKREGDAARESEALGRRYMDLNLPGRARRILERALGFQEEAGALDLLVKSLIKLRKPKLAAAAGERLVNRLRREGKAEEAREAASQLLSMGDDENRKRLLRAAGVDHRKTLALLCLGGIVSLGFVPVKAEEATRAKYIDTVRQVQNELNSDHDLSQMNQVLGALALQVEPLTLGDSPAAEKSAEILTALNDMRSDCQQAGELFRLLPWQEQSDVETVWKRVDALIRPSEKTPSSVRSDALRKPLERLHQEIAAYRDRAIERKAQLDRLPKGPEAYAMAATAREEFAGLPSFLRGMSISVELVTDPAGASVVYDGTKYEKKTPMSIRVPLRGSRELEVRHAGYKRKSRPVDFDALGGRTRVFVRLKRGRRAAPRSERTPPRVDRKKPPRAPTGRRDPKRPRVGVSSTRPSRKGDPKRPAAQVTLRDGYVSGDRRGLVFEQSPLLFAEGKYAIKLHARYRVFVKAINRRKGKNLHLVAIDVVLSVRRATGWKSERPVRIKFSRPPQRALVAMPGGKRRVLPLARALHLDLHELEADIRGALERAIRTVRDRDKARARR